MIKVVDRSIARACYRAAAAEMERVSHFGEGHRMITKKQRLEQHAAEMLANRLLGIRSLANCPAELRRKIERFMDAPNAVPESSRPSEGKGQNA